MPDKAEPEALASYWLQQIEAWQSSGQTQKAYCKTNELSYHRFGYRQLVRKLRDQAKITSHRLDSLPTLLRYSGRAVIKAQFLQITRRISRSFAGRIIMTPIYTIAIQLHIMSIIHIICIMHPLAFDEAG